MFQLCTNHFVLVLWRSVWVIEACHFFLVPSRSSSTPFYLSKVLRTRERALTPCSSIVFHLGLTFESLKELGARQLNIQLENIVNVENIWQMTTQLRNVFNFIDVTLALGLWPRQVLASLHAKREAQESHLMLPGVQKNVREWTLTLPSFQRAIARSKPIRVKIYLYHWKAIET